MSETSTVVDIDWEKQEALLSNPKTPIVYKVYKPRDGSALFQVKTSQGVLPNSLTGRFSTIRSAISFVEKYLDSINETFSVRSDRLDKERKERNAAKTESKNSKPVQQRVDH